MQMSPQQIEEQLERCAALLREAGVKVTHQRLEIYREVLAGGAHPDAEAVYSGVRKRVPTVSLDTVYRTLWLLAGLGLIGTLGSPRERVRFDANTAPHHHFVCLSCGAALDFTCAQFDELGVPEQAAALGQVQRSYVELRGTCRDCARRDGTSKKQPVTRVT